MYEGCPDGSIEVICGSMFSGKSEELIRRVKRASIAKQKIQLFRHALDKQRCSEAIVKSHSGFSYVAYTVGTIEEIERNLEPDTKVIGIDEAQFFGDEIVELCQKLANEGKRVIIAGLDMDFAGRPFGPMPILLSIAETVDKLHAICMKCGRPASRSQRLYHGEPVAANDPVIEVGAGEKYEARCRQCHKIVIRTEEPVTVK